MTNRIDWKEMTIAAVGLLALAFNPASDPGRAMYAKYFVLRRDRRSYWPGESGINAKVSRPQMQTRGRA
jgi:hypothetical protein